MTRSLADVEAIVDKVFTDDAVFTHALIIAKGKKSIARTYQFWKSVHRKVGYDIERAGTLACSCLELCCPDQSGQVRRDTTFDVVLRKAAVMFGT